MGWQFHEVFAFRQEAYTPGKLTDSENHRNLSFSPLNLGKALSTHKALATTPAGIASSSRAGKKARPEALVHGQMVPMYVNKQGFCASFSLIWLEAVLEGRSERRRQLTDATITNAWGTSKLEALAMAYTSSKTEQARLAGLKRVHRLTWSVQDGSVRQWLFEYVAIDVGWKRGAWNLTRVRPDGRHRLGLYSDGVRLFVFNPSHGEWVMAEDKHSAAGKKDVFFNMMKAAGLSSDVRQINKLEIWECTSA